MVPKPGKETGNLFTIYVAVVQEGKNVKVLICLEELNLV